MFSKPSRATVLKIVTKTGLTWVDKLGPYGAASMTLASHELRLIVFAHIVVGLAGVSPTVWRAYL